jgi:colanic acid biosynthesis glycosyl transferase WcaI
VKILLWAPNYAPELTGIPPLVTDLAGWLHRAGHSVTVVAPVPHYPERVIHSEYRRSIWRREVIGGIPISRHWLRIRPNETFVDKALYELTSPIFALPQVLRKLPQTDVLVVVAPTWAASILATILPGPQRLVWWVQDLVLAAAASVASVRSLKIVTKVLRGLEAHAASRVDEIVVCSEGFRAYYVKQGIPSDRITVVHNWVDTDWIRAESEVGNARPLFVYAGNIGYTQGLERLVEAAALVPEVDVEIVGDGNARIAIQTAAAGVANVRVKPPVPNVEYPGLLRRADAHIVMQRYISSGVNLPSKIAPYLASGRPIVASVDAEAPVGQLLAASGAAIITEPESAAQLAAALRRIGKDKPLRHMLGINGRAYAERELAELAQVPRLMSAIVGRD